MIYRLLMIIFTALLAGCGLSEIKEPTVPAETFAVAKEPSKLFYTDEQRRTDLLAQGVDYRKFLLPPDPYSRLVIDGYDIRDLYLKRHISTVEKMLPSSWHDKKFLPPDTPKIQPVSSFKSDPELQRIKLWQFVGYDDLSSDGVGSIPTINFYTDEKDYVTEVEII